MQKQIIVLFTLLTFSLSSPLPTFSETVTPKAPGRALSLEHLAIPESLGKIETRFKGTSERWVVYIQDVHAHFAAQENIAAIVDHLNAVYGIRVVGLEGGWSEQSFPKSWAIPSSREKQMLARDLLEKDYLTGPAYAALFSQTPIRLVGIEEESLYEKDRGFFVEHLGQRETILSKLADWKKALDDRKKISFNAELLGFDNSLENFRDGHQAEKFLPMLLNLSRLKQIELSDLDQVLLYEKISIAEKALDKQKLQSEASRLLEQFKRTRLSFEELLRNGKIAQDKLEFYPETTKYLEIMKLQDALHHRKFFEQIEAAVNRLRKTLTETPEEEALSEESDRYQLTKKLLLISATPDDIKGYKSNEAAIKTDLEKQNLNSALTVALHFYEHARERDNVFFDKITNDQKLTGDIAIVTGGFHTGNLGEKLEAAGISYIVITPDLAKEAPDEALYFKRLQEDLPDPNLPKTQTIQSKLKFLTGEPKLFDDQLAEAYLILTQTRDISAATKSLEASSPRGQIKNALAISAEDFLKLSNEEQLSKVQSWLESVKDAKLPITVVIKVSLLKKLLATPEGIAVWERFFAPERTNKAGLLPDDPNALYLDATIGIAAQVIRLPEGSTLDQAVESRFRKEAERGTLAVIDPEYQNAGLLVLPVHPASFVLARLILENGVVTGWNSEEFLDRLDQLLTQILTQASLLQKAA